MNSRVHPKYKTKYRVSNWAEYDRALAHRGDWISPVFADTQRANFFGNSESLWIEAGQMHAAYVFHIQDATITLHA